ncbi:hypothetical protein FKP32DRAFT_1266370 [Trametes sanguinea]|nr:hypothetical protein FKP32DRAFT_1266370 [Trametes sanguinea]
MEGLNCRSFRVTRLLPMSHVFTRCFTSESLSFQRTSYLYYTGPPSSTPEASISYSMPIATYPWYSGRPSFPQPPPRVTPSPLHCQRLESLINYCLQCDEWPGPTAAMHRTQGYSRPGTAALP